MYAGISIDLDSLSCYRRIYGIEGDNDDNMVYEVGLERYAELMEDLGMRGTIFVVAEDLDLGDNRRVLRALAREGHEIANHTLTHDYRLTRIEHGRMVREVGEAKLKLESATGARVTGFRAPGYNMTDELAAVVSETGHRYDSSVFPCYPYYGAKAAVLAAMKMSGRSSNTVMGGPQVLAAPSQPYRIGKSYWRSGAGPLWELPVSTSPALRLPFLGSFILLAGEKWFPWYYRMIKAAGDVLVLNLHGMDFIDGPADGLEPELMTQPDMRIPWQKKREIFLRLFERLNKERKVMPLKKIVNTLEKEHNG